MLGVAVRAPDERDVGYAAVDLMTSGRHGVPEALLSLTFEEVPQFLVSLPERGLGMVSRRIDQGLRQL